MTRFLRAIAVCAIASVSFGGKRVVEEAPRWMTEKDTVRLEIVRKLLDGGDPGRAMELIRIMREEGLQRPELDVLQGAALRQQGMAEDAERLLVRAADELPRDPDVHRELCVLFADEQRYDEAIDACRRATELDEQDPAAWNNLGYLLLTTSDDPGPAKAALQRAVELDGTEARYRNNLAFAQAADGDHRTALRTFLTTSTPADAHYNVGASFERSGDATSALTYYRRALRYDADHLLADEALRRLQAETVPSDSRDPGVPGSEPVQEN